MVFAAAGAVVGVTKPLPDVAAPDGVFVVDAPPGCVVAGIGVRGFAVLAA